MKSPSVMPIPIQKRIKPIIRFISILLQNLKLILIYVVFDKNYTVSQKMFIFGNKAYSGIL